MSTATEKKKLPVVKLITATWLIFTLVGAVMFGNHLGRQLQKPIVEYQTLDYGPYKPGDGPTSQELIETKSHVALFRIEGVISGTGSENAAWVRQMCREMEKAGANRDVKALLVEINSPGGEVAASASIYQTLATVAKDKPVVAYFSSLAASGGYYIGCAANTIIVHPESLTGSIGVIIQSTNYAQAFEKLGLETHTFKSGNLKDMLSGSRPLNPQEKQYTQSLVDSTYESFLDVVATSRNLDPEMLRGSSADGRILKGTAAVELDLADKTGLFNDAIAEARKQADMPNCNIRLYQINTHSKSGLLGLLGQSNSDLKIQIQPTTPLVSAAGIPWSIPAGVPLMLHTY